MILGRENSLRERMFRVILLSAAGISLISIVEGVILNDDKVMEYPMVALILTVIFALLANFKYKRVGLAVWVLGIALVLIVFPAAFYASGGITGGATCWFIMGFVYIFLMFEGWGMVVFFIMAMIVDIGTYIYGYFHPAAIHPLQSKAMMYLDNAFGVIVIGVVIGIIMKFQSRIYEKEREITNQQKEELEETGRARNMFFTKISHEIRTPINTVIGLNEMNMRAQLPDEIIENCNSIHRASSMLLSLVNELLDLSQIETSRMEIFNAEYDTRNLFYNLVDMIQVRVSEKQLKFLVMVDENIPSKLVGDEKRISQVLLNLLTNAVKYTNEGTITLEVRVEKCEGNKIQLVATVADTGIGIRKEDMQYLYDYFHRVDEGQTHKIEGSGLGLSITKQLVELMGGQITVDSIYTKGSNFMVRLEQEIADETPIGQVDFLAKVLRNDQKQRKAYIPSFEAPEARILFVDDSEMNLDVAQKLLRDTKVRVDTAASGAEALQKTMKHFYHIIFLDYMMPELDGVETLQAIRKQENGLCRETPILCLTGNARTESKRREMNYGFDGYLQKPVRGDILEAAILKNIPSEIVEYRREDVEIENPMLQMRQMFHRRKKRVCITTDCICDLNRDMIEKYGIRQIYLYIETEKGRFQDIKEIDCKNMSKYLSSSSSQVTAIAPSVEDYENFFADTLEGAEDVIHLSLAQHTGKSYENAMMAAKGFGHVHVVDSGHISGGLALFVLGLAYMAKNGATCHEILDEVDNLKGNISTGFLLPSANVFYQKGYMNRFAAKISEVFLLHPVLETRGSWLRLVSFRTGNMERARKRYIHSRLRFHRRINTDIIYITHVACSVKEIDFILREIRKNVEFEQVIVERASVSNACNSGIGTIGIAFYKK